MTAPTGTERGPYKAKDVRPDEVANYARLGAPDTEIAAMIHLSPRQLVARYEAELAQGRAERKLKLRQKQTEIALKGNVTMLIWLGKQELGQTDRQELQHSGPGGGPIQMEELTVLRDQLRHRLAALVPSAN